MPPRCWAATHRFSVYWGLPLALLLGFAAGYGLGRVAAGYSLWTQALVTYAFAIAFPQLLRYRLIEGWTGGVQGLYLDFPDAARGRPEQRPLGLPDGARPAGRSACGWRTT